MLILGVAAIWAQDQAEMPQSPQSEATAGLTATDADKFMSVTEWDSVKFGKAFTFLGFKQGSKSTVDAGAAFRVGPVYIGSWYQGNLGWFNGNGNKSETNTITENSGLIGNTQKTTEIELHNQWNGTHNAAMLVGFGNMGFNFGYYRKGKNDYGRFYGSGFSNKDSETTNTNAPGVVINKITYDPKGYMTKAIHTPFIGFGMNLQLGKMALSPKASVKITVAEEAYYGVRTVETIGTASPEMIKDAEAESKAYIGITGGLGADLSLGDALDSVITLGYDFTVNAYGKNYTSLDGRKHKIKGTYKVNTDQVKEEYTPAPDAAKTKTDTFKMDITEKGYFSNMLMVGYGMKKDFTERLSLFAGVEAPVTLMLTTDTTKNINRTFVKTEYNDPSNIHNNNTSETVVESPSKTTKTTTVILMPKLKAAVSYAAIPNRLFLNLGTTVNIFGGEGLKNITTQTTHDSHITTTTITTKYDDGRETKTTASVAAAKQGSLEKTTTYKNASVELKGGLRWSITENFDFDLVYSNTLLNPSISLTSLGNLKLACTLKF